MVQRIVPAGKEKQGTAACIAKIKRDGVTCEFYPGSIRTRGRMTVKYHGHSVCNIMIAGDSSDLSVRKRNADWAIKLIQMGRSYESTLKEES